MSKRVSISFFRRSANGLSIVSVSTNAVTCIARVDKRQALWYNNPNMDEKLQNKIDNVPATRNGDPVAADNAGEIISTDSDAPLTDGIQSDIPITTDGVVEFDAMGAEEVDESMRGGYASVNGKLEKNGRNTVWIVLIVMVCVCFVVGICSSVLTAHFMRKGENPPVISTNGELQQNVTAVVTARKSSIAEVRCGGLSSSGIVMKREGSGVIILTNAHAISQYVQNNRLPAVRFFGEDSYYESEVVGYDDHYDIAVLRVVHDTLYDVFDLDGSKFLSPDVTFLEGDYVVSIGNAMGMGIAAYDGIISRKSELLECDELFRDEKKTVPVLRTTAVINAGMSGGGVFDMHGNLVGLGTYRMSNSAGADTEGSASTDVENTGFATPMSIVYPVYKRILQSNDGKAVGLFNVSAQKSGSSAVGYLSLPFGVNCIYLNGKLTVDSASGDYAKTVKKGDVLTKIGSYTVTTDICDTVGALLRYHRNGDGRPLTLTFTRDGAAYPVTLDDYKYAI